MRALALRVALLLAAAACAPAAAELVPPAGRVDPRVRVVAYDPDNVVRLRGFVGYQIHLQWAEGEEFVRLGSGDAGGFDIGVERNHFFIKPRAERVSTNLTVLTTRRAYQFDYSVARAPANPAAARDLVYSIRFVYPADDARALAAAAEQRAAEDRRVEALAARPRNLDYWYCGAPGLKPVVASDDGVHTRLRFAARAELPAVFVAHDDGAESLVNSHVEGEEIVVHRVARRLVLRRGALVGCVVNRAGEVAEAQPAPAAHAAAAAAAPTAAREAWRTIGEGRR